MMVDFELQILRQYWIDNSMDNGTDLCSHGEIYLRINSEEILTEADNDWTVSTSVLLLLRTLFQDYRPDDEPALIIHCGMLLMSSCPISVTWGVKHKGEQVFIDQVRKNPTISISDSIEFASASLALGLREYARPILKCAEDVADFFKKSEKRKFSSTCDKDEYERFWDEFRELKSKAERNFWT